MKEHYIKELLDIAVTMPINTKQIEYKANSTDYLRFKILEKGYNKFGADKTNDGYFTSLLYSPNGAKTFHKIFDESLHVIQSTIWLRYMLYNEFVHIKNKATSDFEKYIIKDRLDHGNNCTYILQNKKGLIKVPGEKIVYWKLPNEPYDNGKVLDRWFSHYETSKALKKELDDLKIDVRNTNDKSRKGGLTM